MTAETQTALSEDALCSAIADALKAANNTATLSGPVTMQSRMGSPREWDSLSFVTVFVAVSEHFGVQLDDDDAIHFQAVQTIYDLLADIL